MKISKENIVELLRLLLPFAKKPIESWVVKFFLNFGGTLLLAGLTTPIWQSLLLGLSDKYLGTNLSESNTTLMVVLVTIAFLSWTIGLMFYWLMVHKQNVPKPKDVSIYQHSIENVVNKNPVSDDEELYEIDLRFELKDKSDYGIKKAIEKQFDLTKSIQEMIKREHHSQVNYYGLASIPFTMLLGYNISDKYDVVFNEWDNNQKEWLRLSEDTDYPEILVTSKNPLDRTKNSGELIVRVNFTTRVEDEHIENLALNVLNIIDFGVEVPKRGIITSKTQIVEYQNAFRELMDDINDKYPNIKRIHLFMSAQSSIVFTIGSKISERMDAEVVIYEHAKQNENDIRYPWGLILSKENRRSEDVYFESEKGELHVLHE